MAPNSSSSSSSIKVVIEQKETKRTTGTLHSVRKPPVKPWKRPVAQLPPPRVYCVHSSKFRDVVQKLTGRPESQTRRLQSVAPPPLNLTTSTLPNNNVSASLQPLQPPETLSSGVVYNGFPSKALVEEPMKAFDSFPATNSLALMSPTWWYPWCSSPFLSPGTMASLEQSIVL